MRPEVGNMGQMVQLLGRRAALFGLVALVGCDALGSKASSKKRKDDDEEDEDDDKKKTKKKKGGDEEGDGESSAKPAEAKSSLKPGDIEKIAYFLGHSWAFACTFTMLDSADGVQRNMKQVKTYVAGLHLADRSAPTSKNAVEQMRSMAYLDAVEKAHGTTAAMAYWCGVSLGDAFFGAGLDIDISKQLADFEKSAKGAKIPERVWRSQLDAIKPAAKKGPLVSALQASVEKHYREL